MTISLDKAIEILKEKQREDEPHWERGDRDAIKLGIEALKRVKEEREEHTCMRNIPLPGETR